MARLHGAATTERSSFFHDWVRLRKRAPNCLARLTVAGLGKYGIVIIRPEQPEHAASLRWQRAIGPAGLDRLRHIYKVSDFFPSVDIIFFTILTDFPGLGSIDW